MTKQAGIWIDHKKAVIIYLKGNETQVIELLNDEAGRERIKGESDNKSRFGFQSFFPEKRTQKRRELHLHHFYEKVIEKVKHFDSILIFGPSSAKAELREEIQKRNDLEVRTVATEPMKKITRNQMIARVKDFFSVSDVT